MCIEWIGVVVVYSGTVLLCIVCIGVVVVWISAVLLCIGAVLVLGEQVL